MTDYLEEHLDRAGALLEQVRRMERSLSGAPAEEVSEERADGVDASRAADGTFGVRGEAVTQFEDAVDGLNERVDRIEKAVDIPRPDGEPLSREPKENGKRQRDEEAAGQAPQAGLDRPPPEEAGEEPVRTNAETAEKTALPLLDQLEELDRAVTALTALLPEEQRAEGLWRDAGEARDEVPAFRSGAGGVYVPGDGWSGGELNGAGSPGAEQEWAERADRVFRRDSRRYDGGFSLY